MVWLPADLAAEADAARAADNADDAAAREADKEAAPGEGQSDEAQRHKVYGDSAYGSGEFQSLLEDAGIDSGCRTQPPVAAGGRFAKDRFSIDLQAGTVTCPAEVTVALRVHRDHSGTAHFGGACATCPLADQCTASRSGRTINVTPHEASLARARSRQTNPGWGEDYRATRPKVERKLGHLMRRKHGGRRARVRGTIKVDADFNLLAAAVNVARVAVAGIRSDGTGGWATTA
ncbi:MAG: transposase [Acidimicrobiales bacterium]